MRKVFTLISLFCVLSASAVTFSISDGISNNATKSTIESNMTALLNEINNAEAQNRAIDFTRFRISQSAQVSLSMLWENTPFKCVDDDIVERCITTPNGFQVRNIPLELKPLNDYSYEPDEYYQEAVISFNRQGEIQSFYLTLSTKLYTSVIKSNLELTDLRRRQLILDFVERFRTSYNTKDIKFLEQIFSEDALIITGTVVKNKELHMENVVYKVQDKQQYLTNLRRVFANNKYIKVTFDEIEVMKHPNPNLTDFYGVTLHQGYTSSNYHDDGYLFLMWDFRDEDHPQITVRTWQPDKLNGSKIDKDDIFSLNDFTEFF